MSSPGLEPFHRPQSATFTSVNGVQVIASYGNPAQEYVALTQHAGVADLSQRGRICLTGADRVRFLNGQVTNNIKTLAVGQGCYAALVTAKGRMESDLNVYVLADELLLDFEPGFADRVHKRLESFVIADDVQVVDVSSLYSLFSVAGPKAPAVVAGLGIVSKLPDEPYQSLRVELPHWGESYCVYQPRYRIPNFDFFVPNDCAALVAQELWQATLTHDGQSVGLVALEMARIEAGVPRYGLDIDETNLVPETGLETSTISYSKGCYIGQEVIARIRTYGQVAKTLRGLALPKGTDALPERGDKLLHAGKEVGYVTSALVSPAFGCPIALGYVRREHPSAGTALKVVTRAGEIDARIASLPFHADELNH